MNNIYDTIIIGAGISGMTAAIYLKRYDLNVLIIEKEVPGGQIGKASLIENYPGFKSIDGITFTNNLLEQINSLNIKINYENVIEIISYKDMKKIKTTTGEYYSKTVIIATGRKPKQLTLNDNLYIGKGLSYCATCDGMFFRNEEVVIVGGGNSALEESLYLSDICSKVTIINRSNNLKADKILVDKVRERENIEILYSKEIKNIICDEVIKGVILNDDKFINCKGLFVYIGLTPNIVNIKDLELQNGYIHVDNNMKTNINGIYAVGDVTKKELYQLVTAASDGAIAANQIKNDLRV